MPRINMSGFGETALAVALQWVQDHGCEEAHDIAIDRLNLSTSLDEQLFWGDVRDNIRCIWHGDIE